MAYSLGMYMESLIFCVSDSHLFFKDLEVSTGTILVPSGYHPGTIRLFGDDAARLDGCGDGCSDGCGNFYGRGS